MIKFERVNIGFIGVLVTMLLILFLLADIEVLLNFGGFLYVLDVIGVWYSFSRYTAFNIKSDKKKALLPILFLLPLGIMLMLKAPGYRNLGIVQLYLLFIMVILPIWIYFHIQKTTKLSVQQQEIKKQKNQQMLKNMIKIQRINIAIIIILLIGSVVMISTSSLFMTRDVLLIFYIIAIGFLVYSFVIYTEDRLRRNKYIALILHSCLASIGMMFIFTIFILSSMVSLDVRFFLILLQLYMVIMTIILPIWIYFKIQKPTRLDLKQQEIDKRKQEYREQHNNEKID